MLTDEKILEIISAELENSIDASNSSVQTALNYYLGKPNGKEVAGRSEVNSTDVADAIEWIMPQIMEQFTLNNEVVTFDPAGAGDEEQAEMESEYVYDVLMKENPGFVVIYQFVKDALMQRVGITKTFYTKETKIFTEEYTGLVEEQIWMLLADEDIELLELTEHTITNDGQPMASLFDVKVSISEEIGKIKVLSVPREHFRINSDHNMIDVENARFTAHVAPKTVSDLIEEGLIKKVSDAEDMPKAHSGYDKNYRFFDDEKLSVNHSEDESQRELSVAECYLHIDVDEDGIAEYMKITVAGAESPSDVLLKEKIDYNPWTCTTAIIMSHKFEGMSIFDRLKEIQDQKTTLWRNMFDNLYLQNNQKTAVVDNQVNLDDLLVSRPGGIVRVKRIDAIQTIETPKLGQEAYQMMEYLDQVRAGRTGVSADGNAAPQNVGDRIGSLGVERLMTAKEALVNLMVRVISETGIKPICCKIRDLSVVHIDTITDFKFKGIWHKVNPSEWRKQRKSTVRVGTGTGDRTNQIMSLEKVLSIQEKILANPNQTMVREEQVFAAIDDLCRLNRLHGAAKYFTDPASDEGKRRKSEVEKASQEAKSKEEQMQFAMAKAQIDLAKAEMAKASAQMEGVRLKAKNDYIKSQLVNSKQIHEKELRILEIELNEAQKFADNSKSISDLAYKYEDLNKRIALELTRIEAEYQKEQNENYNGNVASIK